MNRLLVSAAAASLVAFSVCAQDAAPAAVPAAAKPAAKAVPSAFPVAGVANTGWALEFTHGIPKAVSVKGADGKIKWWWYMTFRVENREGEPHLFIPRVEVATDTGHIYKCSAPVPQDVYNIVYKHCGNALTEPMVKIAGVQRPGKDFIHDSVAIWPAPEKEDVDAFTVYVSGIYGETQPVNDPATGKPLMAPVKDSKTGEDEKNEAGEVVMAQVELNRTLRLEYACPGTGTAAHTEGVTLVSSDDVMR
jgi:hypothetical protein